MPRFLPLFAFIAILASPSHTLASYHVFCEIEGEVSSTPVFSDLIKFEFKITASRDIEFEDGGRGEPDCHLLKEKSIMVVLDPESAGDQAEIFEGARLVIRRYELTVDLIDSEEFAQSVEYERISR